MSIIAPNSYTKLKLSETEVENFQSDYYRVENFGFVVFTTNEQHGTWVYPTPANINPPGWFALTIWPVAIADVNGDALDDLVIRSMMYPHTVARSTELQPMIFNQTSAGLSSDPSGYIEASKFPSKYHLNQIGVGDFNNDGYDDLAFGSEGEHRYDNGLITNTQTPLVVFGGADQKLEWTDSAGDVTATEYGASHIMSVGDFNGDGFDDWVSGWYAFYSEGNGSFAAERLSGIGNNAATSADVNNDGYSDLIFSSMPSVGDVTQNGGDLKIMFGSEEGLKDGSEIFEIFRSRTINDNVGTSYITPGDFNGDGRVDLILAEHGWVTDSGDSSDYYAKSFFRFFAGDGLGSFVENSSVINDPFAKTRKGGANLYSIDVNGDGWLDLVVVGGELGGVSWSSSLLWDATSVFLNNRGTLTLVDTTDLAFVEPYQMSGYESMKQWQQMGIPKSYPIDLGNDGLVDFVGFVETPLGSVPQNVQRYTYGYISRATKPLGRDSVDEVMSGTLGSDKIFGYQGNDIISGLTGDDVIDGGVGFDTVEIASTFSDLMSVAYASDGRGVVVTSAQGRDSMINVERVQFLDAEYTPAQLINLLPISAEFSFSKDGQSSGISPTLFTGPASLNLHYQLIDTTPGAIIAGSVINDFIVLQGGGNKAVNGGLGDDVIDGGTGSTFVSGGGGTNTFFLDGRASGVSWSTITDFQLGQDKATIWGWKEGVSRVKEVVTNGGAAGYTGLTLHFENLLPDGSASSARNSSLNSITFSNKSLSDFGAESVTELNEQIASGSNSHFIVGQTTDGYGDHGYLFIS